jgi:putative membrane protein
MVAVVRAAFPGWAPHPDVWLIVGLAAAGYYILVERIGPTVVPPGQPVVRRRHVVSFSIALIAFWLASDWPVHDVAERYLYSVHMVQHMLYALIVAPLLIRAAPEWMARWLLVRTHTLGLVRTMSRFAPALFLFNAVFVLVHVPAVVSAALANGWIHLAIHVLLLVSSVIVWMPVLSPLPEVPRFQPPVQMAYLFLQSVLPVIPTAFLSYGTHPLYRAYERFPRLWGISALSDQQMAANIMKTGTGLVLWTIIAIVFFKWFAAEESPMRTPKVSRSLSREIDHDLLGLHRP